MTSLVSASQVVTGQVQSLDSVRAHALPSDALIFASATKVQPVNQNLGSYAWQESAGATTTINGSVPAVTQSPFADLYKEGSVFIDGVAADYISTSLTGYTISQGISMEMFVNYVNFTNSTYTIGFMGISSTAYNFTLGVNGSGAPIVTWTNGTLVSPVTVSANTWNHLACSWDGTTLRLYVNGALGNSTTSFVQPGLVQNFSVGRANSLTCTAYVTSVRLVTNPAVYTGSTLTVPSAPLSPAATGTTNFMMRAGQNVPTIQSGALTFDRGLKQYMNFGPATFNIVTQGFTAVWRGQMTGTPGSYETIFQGGLVNSTNGWFALIRSVVTSSFYFALASSTTNAQVGSTGLFTLNQNTPYVVAARYNPTTQIVDVWVNGLQVSSAALTTATLVGDRTVNGYAGYGYSSFTSMTSNTLAVYNRALSNVEILNAYSALTTNTVNAPIEIGDSNGTPALSIAGDGRVNVTKMGQTSNVVAWPPAAMTGYVTSINGGTYVASTSSEFPTPATGYPYAWYAFDKNTSNYWVTNAPLYSQTGSNAYTGTITTPDVNGTVYPGEWLQIQKPASTIVSSYVLTINGVAAAPQTFVILGSRDGVNWFLVDSRSTVTWTSVGQSQTFSITSTQAYSYYRIVTRNIAGNGTYVQLQEWILYGTADTAQALTVAQPTQFTYPVQTPQLTGVSNPGVYAPQDFSSSGLNVPAYVVSNTATVANTVAFSSFGPFAGEGSLYFPGGTGGYVNFPAASTPLWPGGVTTLEDGTIEMWVYLTQSPAGTNSMFFDRSSPSASGVCWWFGTTAGQLKFQYNNGTVTDVTAGTVPYNSWNHVAVTVKSNIITVFLNGAPGSTGTFSGSLTGSSSYSLYMSQYINPPTSIGQTVYGYIASARITRGAALYTSAFTPPVGPLQPIQGTTQSGLPYGTVLLLRNAPAPGRVVTQKFAGSNSGQVLSFPPAAMTGYATNLNAGYGQGTYVASASSEFSASFPAWSAFDNLATDTTRWASGANTYASGLPSGTIPVTTDVAGGTYSGSWIQFQMPIAIVPTAYNLATGGNVNFGATSLALLGSRDGANWYLVDSRAGISGWVATTVRTFSIAQSQAFTYFRIVNMAIGSSATDGGYSYISFNGTIESVNVTADGRVGLGVVNPVQALEVAGSAVVAGTLSAGNPLMFRNRIINGNFDVWQRGTSFSSPATATYTADRFNQAWDGSGATRTISQQVFTAGQTDVPNNPKYFYRFAQTVAGSGGTFNNFCTQYIEGVQTFAGQAVTVSLWAKAPVGTPYVNSAMRQVFGTSGSTNVDVSPYSQSSFTLTANWQKYTFQYFVPSITGKTIGTANDCLALFTYTNPNAVVTVDIAQVQVEQGTVATPFEVRPYATELALCQRYFHRTCNVVTQNGGTMLIPMVIIDASRAQGIYKLPVSMRSNAITLNSTGTFTLDWWQVNNNGVTAVALAGNAGMTSADNASVMATGLTNGSVGSITIGQVRFLTTSTGYIDFVAEL